MLTLVEHNELLRQALGSSRIDTGVRCNGCGTELSFVQPEIHLSSWPSQKAVCCKNCDFTGFMVI